MAVGTSDTLQRGVGLLRRGDLVQTIRPIRAVARAFLLPRGATGLIGELLATREDDGETLEIWDFVADDFPGRWAVTEYHVRLMQRDT